MAALCAGVLGQEINADVKTPQILQLGVYHDLTDTVSLTGDVLWIDFSEFGLEQVSVGDNSTTITSDYEDMWGVSIRCKVSCIGQVVHRIWGFLYFRRC